MHQDWKIERREEKYVYTHIRVAHILFRMGELPHLYRVEQVAFWVDVASVRVSAVGVALVEVLPCLSISSVSGDTVLRHFGKEGSRPSDFPEA